MNQGWESKKLGDVCNIICGQDYKSVQDDSGKYPIYGTGGIMGYASQYRCPAHTIIIGRKGSINNPIYVETEFWNVDTAFGVVPNKQYILPKFFYLFCKDYDFTRHDVSVTIPSLRRTDILNIDVPVPPIAEQEKIVAELDCLSSIIEKKKQQLKELDILAQSIFYEMFGDPLDNDRQWTIRRLGDISTKIANGYNAKLDKDTYKLEGIPYFRCQNIWWNYIDYADIVYIDDATNRKMKASSLQKNDLVISKIGRVYTDNSSLGRTAIYEGESGQANISGNLCFVRLDSTVVPKYILSILTMEKYRKWAMRNTPGGIDKRAMSVSQISEFPIIIPPVDLQATYVNKIEAIEKQKELIRQSIQETETLFNSRMDYYFN